MNEIVLAMAAWPAVTPGHACSKMPGAEGIALLIVAAYVAYALLVFVAAAVGAVLRARKRPEQRWRIGMTHLAAALTLTVGPPLYLYVNDAVVTRAAQKSWARESAEFEAWKAGIVFQPGHVAPMLDQAFAALPRDHRWNDAQWTYVLQRGEFEAFERSPATEWQPEDLAAFATFTSRLAHASNRPPVWHSVDTIAPIVAWDLDRANLAAALALCADSDPKARDVCRDALRFTVRGWCAANRGRCDELERMPTFRQAAIDLGVVAEASP